MRGLRIVTAGVVIAVGMGIGGAALAQIPTLPSVPDVPAPVSNAVMQVEGTVYPPLFTAAEAASPVATAGGFALRPPCGELGLAAFAIGVAGPSVPLGVLGLEGPAFIFCGGAFAPGPADPYFAQVDQAVGPTLGSRWHTAAKKISAQLEPAASVRPDLCGGVEIAYPTSLLVPPANRIDPSEAVC